MVTKVTPFVIWGHELFHILRECNVQAWHLLES